jgi:hypothetical protein
MSAPPPLLSEAQNAVSRNARTGSDVASGNTTPNSSTPSSNTPAKQPGTPGSFNAPAWSAHVDKATGQTYYANRITQETTWTKPADYVPPGEEDVGDDWVKILDANTGKYYYANRKTMQTSWTVPEPVKKKQQQQGNSVPTTPTVATASSPQNSTTAQTEASPTSYNSTASSTLTINSFVSTGGSGSNSLDEPLIPPPMDYERILDPASGRFYYVHIPTRSVSWKSPEAFKAFEDQEKRFKSKESAKQGQTLSVASSGPSHSRSGSNSMQSNPPPANTSNSTAPVVASTNSAIPSPTSTPALPHGNF